MNYLLEGPFLKFLENNESTKIFIIEIWMKQWEELPYQIKSSFVQILSDLYPQKTLDDIYKEHYYDPGLES